jgi:hypothetical protein
MYRHGLTWGPGMPRDKRNTGLLPTDLRPLYPRVTPRES